MLVPIGMMTLVGHLASASDLAVTAKVPAPMPKDAPVITKPVDGSIISSNTVVVSGICPIIKPAVIIVIYVRDAIAGSTPCSADGKFSVQVTLGLGMQEIIAQVVTITDDIGKSSAGVTVLRAIPSEPSRADSGVPTDETLQALPSMLGIVTNNRFVPIGADGNAKWRGSFAGGTLPYKVSIDWGDGTAGNYGVNDESEQVFSHRYDSQRFYDIVITVTDANGGSATLHSAAMRVNQQSALLDRHFGPIPEPFALIQKYLWQIYILTLSGLVFLWYLEHGRHLLPPYGVVGHKSRRTHRHRRV